MAANVAFIRPELAKLLPQYTLIRDALAGETVVKDAKTKYLPMPNAHDDSKENIARYASYLKRAVFYNVARRTLYGLIGQVFKSDPVVKVPSMLNPLLANATGSGINFNQLAKQAVGFTLAQSRAGLMVDYPAVDPTKGSSVQDVQSGQIRPTLYVYPPASVINWRTIDRGAEEVLSLVVIFETYCVGDDGFEMKHSGQFRALYLDESGYYVHEIWREPIPTANDGSKPPKQGNYQMHTRYTPTDSSGARLTDIPFMFIGSENNDPNPDNPNFYDICSVNMAHYRNSADYEEACYITGQPTVVMTGLTEEWVANVLKGSVNFGSRGGIPLPVGGDAKLLQAAANTMLKEAMDAKEHQMISLGAKLVEEQSVQKTATQSSIDSSNATSTLSQVVTNCSDALTWALKFAARWIGQSDAGVSCELNKDFDVSRMTAEERQEVIKEWQAGAITFGEMRTGLRKSGIVTEDDAAAQVQIAKDTAESLALVAEHSQPPEPDDSSVGNGD